MNLIQTGQHGGHNDLTNAATFKVGDLCVHHHILTSIEFFLNIFQGLYRATGGFYILACQDGGIAMQIGQER